MTDEPKTLQQAIIYFADLDRCETYMRQIRWQGGVPVCPKCGAKGQRIGEIKTRGLLRCKDCRKQFSSRYGTVFEASKITLDKWFVAVWLIANCKNGVSSYELERAIGVDQKTAWFMLHRIRAAMEVTGINDKFDGPAEADATYVGGKAANMHRSRREKTIRGRGAVGKTIVHGVLQRGEPSQIRADVVSGDEANQLVPAVRRHVRGGASIYTDAAPAYNMLALTHWHKAIDHAKTYAAGEIHTNGLENFWSLLKRSLGGTYIAVAPFHLFRYTAEQVFRFNQRIGSDFDRFQKTLSQIGGKRLTYRTLTGKDDAGFMGLT